MLLHGRDERPQAPNHGSERLDRIELAGLLGESAVPEDASQNALD